MRKYIEIIEAYNKACKEASKEAINTIIEITSLGEGFENEGAVLRRKVSGTSFFYVLAPTPTLEAIDTATKEAAEANSDDDKIKILVRLGILLQLSAT